MAAEWTNQEVVERWHRWFSGSSISQQFALGATLTKPEKNLLSKDITPWRQRLIDISWFMRLVNESIARRANSEDKCTGHFWEGRFKSQALLDDKALLACMAYVDLNPVRVGIAKTPETSEFSCVQQQIAAAKSTNPPNPTTENFVGGNAEDIGLPLPSQRLPRTAWLDGKNAKV